MWAAWARDGTARLHGKFGACWSHPHLERAEGMLGRLATLIFIEALLHGFEHVLVLPPCDAPIGDGIEMVSMKNVFRLRCDLGKL
jgi:hypothetical protein